MRHDIRVDYVNAANILITAFIQPQRIKTQKTEIFIEYELLLLLTIRSSSPVRRLTGRQKVVVKRINGNAQVCGDQ